MSVYYPERMFTREQVRAVDQLAREKFHMPGVILMENAARGLSLHAMKMLDWPNQTREENVLIVCGGGNNGGDGMALARHLVNASLKCALLLAKPPDSYKGEAGVNLKICRAMRIPIIEAAEDPAAVLAEVSGYDLVVDGLLGTGLSSEVRAPADQFIEWMNTGQDAPVLAIDIPSGLDCDTGQPLGDAVRADMTVTFVGVKRGFLEKDARRYTGDVRIVSIGVPRILVSKLGKRIPG